MSVDFDHYDEVLAQDPYPTLADLRDRCPVAHSEAHGGFWIVSRYEDVEAVTHDPEHFSSRHTSIPSEFGLGDFVIPPVQLDPPAHSRVKRLLARTFVPAVVSPFEPAVREFTRQMVDELASEPSFDAATRFARLVPTALISQLLGAPEAVQDMVGWVDRMLEQAAEDPDGAIAAGMELLAFVADLVARRKEEPGSDVISAFLGTEVDGDRLTDEEITLIGILLVIAGIDTTQHTLGSALHHLAKHPADQARLRNEPELMDTAVEEFLRAFAPVSPARVVTTDTVFEGHELHAGDMVLVSLPSANRDERAFDRADELVLDRSPNRHLAFGSGIHRCLGVNFARMELRVALEEFVGRFSPFEMTDGSEVVWTRGQVRGPKHLFVTPLGPGAGETGGHR
jgi:cytochrome P450